MSESPQSLTMVLFAWRRLIVRTTIGAGIVAIAVSLLLPRWYTASATIMPPREGGSGGGLLQLFSQIGTDLGTGTGKAARRLFGRSQTTEVMIGVLQSRRLRGELVDQFDLVSIYDVPTREHAIRQLQRHIRVDTTPEGLIRVEVEARDRERAANMANALVAHLDDFNRRTSVEDAQRTVRFIETCLEENRARRDAAAERLGRFQEEHGAVQITEQTRATVEALAGLQAERMRLDVRRGVLENYTSVDNFEVRRLGDEMRELDRAIAMLRGSAPDSGNGADALAKSAGLGALLPLAEIPQLGIEYADLRREVLVQEQVYEFLAAQFEEARIQASRDEETVQFLDEAVPPIRKSRPRRSLIVVLTGFLALLTSVGIALAGQSMLERFRPDEPGTREIRHSIRPLLRFLGWLRDWGRSEPTASGPTESP